VNFGAMVRVLPKLIPTPNQCDLVQRLGREEAREQDSSKNTCGMVERRCELWHELSEEDGAGLGRELVSTL
jgi:hypothetical protein